MKTTINDTFLTGTLRNVGGNWLFRDMTAGPSSPLSYDHYYYVRTRWFTTAVPITRRSNLRNVRKRMPPPLTDGLPTPTIAWRICAWTPHDNRVRPSPGRRL
jgi:hypothetical protein